MTISRMTAAQRRAWEALRMLGEMVVLPDDARPLRALKRRGLIRYARRDGVLFAVLRLNSAQERVARAYGYNVPREFLHLFWAGWKTRRHLKPHNRKGQTDEDARVRDQALPAHHGAVARAVSR